MFAGPSIPHGTHLHTHIFIVMNNMRPSTKTDSIGLLVNLLINLLFIFRVRRRDVGGRRGRADSGSDAGGIRTRPESKADHWLAQFRNHFLSIVDMSVCGTGTMAGGQRRAASHMTRSRYEHSYGYRLVSFDHCLRCSTFGSAQANSRPYDSRKRYASDSVEFNEMHKWPIIIPPSIMITYGWGHMDCGRHFASTGSRLFDETPDMCDCFTNQSSEIWFCCPRFRS